MKNLLLTNTLNSLRFYRKDYLSQFLVIALLAAVLTGSLFTGSSVRESLKDKSSAKLGNTSIVISSTGRYFNAALSQRLSENLNYSTTPVLETSGFCQNFSTGSTVLNITILGIDSTFFSFHGLDTVIIPQGTVAINKMLAERLEISEGEEVIVKFTEADPIPPDAPFAPSEDQYGSLVMKVSKILESSDAGSFSLGISQAEPLNVFINLDELQRQGTGITRVNRLLLPELNGEFNATELEQMLKDNLELNDFGLTIRRSEHTGEYEIVSDRIFIDSILIAQINDNLSGGEPVLTYLANYIGKGDKETPYSFIAGLSEKSDLPDFDNSLLINRWLAEDLGAVAGDSVKMGWYIPDKQRLEEKEALFVIQGIIENDSPFSDPALMPDFPGISGSTTCSSWDAGVPLLLDKIREKDEAYWNTYKGTPKAFMGYDSAKKLWGNNFGQATSIRFGGDHSAESIAAALNGRIEPSSAGFVITDARKAGEVAAENSVDFGTLFISLGFFIIVSCIIILIFTVSMFLDTKTDQMKTLYSLGFRNRTIVKYLLAESGSVVTAASIAGAFAGFLICLLLVSALNSVWKGAVQTDSIRADFSLITVLTGSLSTMFISILIYFIRVRQYLRRLSGRKEGLVRINYSPARDLYPVLISGLLFIFSLVLNIFISRLSIELSFTAGIFLFVFMVLLLRLYYVRTAARASGKIRNTAWLTKAFYSFYPSRAYIPVIFIATGIFAVIITAANRKVPDSTLAQNSSGTGGYLLWMETALPLKENLSRPEVRTNFGIEDAEYAGLELIQARKLSGDDASCLNLNFIEAPPLLGINTDDFISRSSFSFATILTDDGNKINPWASLNKAPVDNIIFGIADQTVLKWGLKKSVGDTLIYRSETGDPVKIVICGGLNSSVFQGYVLIGENNFRQYFQSVSGSSVFLADADTADAERLTELLNLRFSGYGMAVQMADEKLASFYIVTNTYLNVFTILGIFGMILGVGGLGFVMLRNIGQRRKEFALLLATGFTLTDIRRSLIPQHSLILIYGLITGTLSALVSTLPTIADNRISPWLIFIMIAVLAATGLIILMLAAKSLDTGRLTGYLRRE